MLHRKIWLPVDFAQIVNAADIRVRDLARDPHFVVKAGQQSGIPRHRFRQEFHGRRLIEPEVVGAIDLAMPPLPSNPMIW